ncbi:MAG TPA: hypothetical protein VJ848_05595 [Candidatus Angelobacter sp.]|nr:hypothetical protein [Candidatus Angelobacter sp.]
MPAQLSANGAVKSTDNESGSASSASASTPRVIALGTTLLAEFSGSLNVKKLKPGDKVKAVLAQDLLAGGQIIARVDSKLIGHVSEIKHRSPTDPESRLGVVFDKIILKNHRELNFQAIVQALAPPVQRRSRVDEPDQMMPPPTLTVGSNFPGQSSSRHSSSSNRSTSTATTLATTMGTTGPMTTVGSTPGMTPGDGLSRARTQASTTAPASAGVGMHGVYGLKGLALAAPGSAVESGPAIISTKSDVKLESGTQVILLVVN